MKHNLTILASLLCGVALFSACRKDNEGAIDLDALIADKPSSNEKVYINSSNFACWHNNDKVNINGTEYAVSSTDATNAKISEVTKAETYTAAYPAEYVNSCNGGIVTMDIPSSQIYTEGSNGEQNIVCPMVGYSDGSTLAFHNVASLLKIAVTNSYGSDLNVCYIEIISNNADLTGTGSVSGVDGATPTIALTSNTTKSAKLVINEGCNVQANNTSKAYYLVVAPFDAASEITINFYASAADGKNYKFTKTSNSTLTIGRNVMAPLTLTIDGSTTKEEISLMGAGTKEDPYKVFNVADLNKMRTGSYEGNYFLQMGDIDATGTAWLPIGTSALNFKGHYDGGGHSVTIDMQPTANVYGFFGQINGATIENLTINGTCATTTYNTIGGLCGLTSGNCTITNCTNNINVSGKDRVGGIVGSTGGETNINHCINKGNITGSDAKDYGVGGIVGDFRAWATLEIRNSGNEGSITGTSGYASGIVGFVYSAGPATNECHIYNTYCNANITGNKVAGLCVCKQYSGGKTTLKLDNCYYNGTLTGSSLKGVLSYFETAITKYSYTNCYADNTSSPTVNAGESTSAITSTGAKNVARTFDPTTGMHSAHGANITNWEDGDYITDALNAVAAEKEYSTWEKQGGNVLPTLR